MASNAIGTSSYSEAMDLSDLNDCGYDQQSLGSPESTNTSITPPPAAATEVQGSTHSESQDLPVRIRKKPGRKPNPASPALRKAQNRAAQRAFRERKERHMKDLETSIRGIKSQRDKLLQENEKMASENEILKSENWYLKGIVLSLQLVCFQHKLVIPQHCPHVNEQTLSVLAQSIPESISSYLNVNAKSKLQMSQKLMDPSQQQQQQGLSSAPILITQDGVQAVQNKHARSPSGNNSWYHQQSNKTNQAPSHYGTPSTSSSSVQDEFSNIPPLSPMPTSDRPMSMPTSDRPMSMPPQPVMMANEPVTSNLAAIQTLRLRLRLQSACVRMQSMPFAIQPTLLQLAVPHDPRIDLIPTPHMRDRMILFRDQFDLDDCFNCILGGSVFHGGDPAIAGNWQLPAEFFEKYWFLTIDYDIRRYTNEWRKKQGLKEIKSNILSIHQEEKPITKEPSPPLHVNNPPPPPSSIPTLSHEDLSGYLGVQLNKHQPPQPQPQQITPIQLTNGFGIMGSSGAAVNSHSDLQHPSPWQNLMGSKDYDMVMTGLYNPTNRNSDMDQRPN